MDYPENPYAEPPAGSTAAEVLQQWENQIRTAIADQRRVRIVGSGSTQGTNAPVSEAVTLRTTALQGIIAYEPAELVLTAWAGTSVALVQAALAEQGQELPFDPPLGPAQAHTLGGMLALARTGVTRMASGPLRDYVLGLEMLDGTGQRLRFGGTVIKNVAGFDVARMHVGAAGRLGLVTRLSLKVMPKPRADTSVVWPCTQAQALAAMQHLWTQALPFAASAWLPPSSMAGSTTPQAGQLVLRWRGAQAAVAQGLAVGAQLAQTHGTAQTCLPEAEAAALWVGLREHSHAWFRPPSPAHRLQCTTHMIGTGGTGVDALPQATAAEPLLLWHGCRRWQWVTTSPASAVPNAALGAIAARVRQLCDPHAVFVCAQE